MCGSVGKFGLFSGWYDVTFVEDNQSIRAQDVRKLKTPVKSTSHGPDSTSTNPCPLELKDCSNTGITDVSEISQTIPDIPSNGPEITNPDDHVLITSIQSDKSESISKPQQPPATSKNSDSSSSTQSSLNLDLKSSIAEDNELFDLYNDEKIVVFQAIKFPDSESKLIHGHDLAENEAKFIIKRVVTNGLFDEDTYCTGGVIAWNITNTQPSASTPKKRFVSNGVGSSCKRQKYIRGKTVFQTKTLSKVSKMNSGGQLQSNEFVKLSDAVLKLGGRIKKDKVRNDICIIPPETDELTDVEDVDDREMGEISGDSIKETAGTLEIHDNNCEFDELINLEHSCAVAKMSFEEYREKVQEIAKSKDLSIDEIITRLLDLSESVKSQSYWTDNTIQKPRLLTPKEKTNEVCGSTASNIADFKVQHGAKTPIEIWNYMMDEMIELFVEQSISYARYQNDQQFSVTKSEMRQFIGILFLSGYHKVPQVHLMWDTQSDCTIQDVVRTMSRTRFWQIKKYIHFTDNTQLDKSDKFAKIRPLINLMNEKLDSLGNIEDVYSIDEQMVPYSGRHSAKQTNREKTIRFGYKNFWLTTKTGFPIHCIPYAGKKGICGQSGKDLTARVVLQLILTGGISDTDFLFFDNWYAGYKVLAILTALDIRTTATIRQDRLKFLPSQIEGAEVNKECARVKKKNAKNSKKPVASSSVEPSKTAKKARTNFTR